MLKWLLIVPAALVLLAVLAGQLGWLRGHTPNNLGVGEGKLKPPSKTPNSVSSQAGLWPDHPRTVEAAIAPLAPVGDAAATMARLRSVVEAMPGAVVVKSEPDYLYATFSSRLMKYTDDVEFWWDGSVVQVRSASRLGRSDFDVNRKRIEAIRSQLQAR